MWPAWAPLNRRLHPRTVTAAPAGRVSPEEGPAPTSARHRPHRHPSPPRRVSTGVAPLPLSAQTPPGSLAPPQRRGRGQGQAEAAAAPHGPRGRVAAATGRRDAPPPIVRLLERPRRCLKDATAAPPSPAPLLGSASPFPTPPKAARVGLLPSAAPRAAWKPGRGVLIRRSRWAARGGSFPQDPSRHIKPPPQLGPERCNRQVSSALSRIAPAPHGEASALGGSRSLPPQGGHRCSERR